MDNDQTTGTLGATTSTPATSTLAQARSHARSQAAEQLPRPGAPGSDLIWDETVPGGSYATHRLPRGSVLSMTAVTGDTCAAMVVHRADQPIERLNLADTVKVQWQAYLGEGSLLLSDMGRVLMTIVSDTCPPRSHDALCGCTNRRSESARSGSDAGAWTEHPNARDLLIMGLAKHGLTRRDLPPCLNVFGGVSVAEHGTLDLAAPVPAGAQLRLRSEVDVIVTVAVVRHPLDPATGSSAGPVRMTATAATAAPTAAGPHTEQTRTEQTDTDPFRTSTPERARAFENTDESLAGGLR